MPIVPRFELSQTDTQVTVLVFVATIRLDSIEVLLDEESVLHFHASPYSLTLNFAPHEFEDGGNNLSAQYDPSKQIIRIPLLKATKGVIWPNLEMTARLIQPREIPKQWLHSVSSPDDDDDDDDDGDVNTDSTIAEVDTEESVTAITDTTERFGYGFGNLFQNIFTDYCKSDGIAREMLSLPDPENTEPSKRRILRTETELKDFDPDRYDYSIEDDYLYPLVMEFVPFWKTSKEQQTNAVQSPSDDVSHNLAESFHKKLSLSSPFTSDEQLLLSTIPYPLIPKSKMLPDDRLWCGLLDLLVPFVYDHITTMGEATVESAWTITRISSSLSWLDPPETPREALLSLTRRMVVYPYWRNIDFCITVWDHVLCLLEQKSLHWIIKCLLQVRPILEKSEFYYAGNKLFVDPYLYWVQHQDEQEAGSSLVRLACCLRTEIERGTLKTDVDLNLAVYERLALGADGSDSDNGSSSEADDSDEDDCSSEDEDDESATDSDGDYAVEAADTTGSATKGDNNRSSALLDAEEDGTATNKIFDILNVQECKLDDDRGSVEQSPGKQPLLIQVIGE